MESNLKKLLKYLHKLKFVIRLFFFVSVINFSIKMKYLLLLYTFTVALQGEVTLSTRYVNLLIVLPAIEGLPLVVFFRFLCSLYCYVNFTTFLNLVIQL